MSAQLVASRSTPLRWALACAGLSLSVLLVACSSDEGDDVESAGGTDDTQVALEDLGDSVVEQRRGERCEDEVGDLAIDVLEPTDTLTEPAGIDIVVAETEFLGEGEAPGDLRVSFELAGDVRDTDDPAYTVFQGLPGQLTSWELTVRHDDDTDEWSVFLTTYAPEGRALARSSSERLDVEVAISDDGSTLEYTVPGNLVPPVVSVWVFGASATLDGEVVYDECERLDERIVGS